MSYLFRPPTNTHVVTMEGSLRYSFDVSMTTWKTGGVWYSQETPPYETLAAADLYLLGRPQIISDALAADLIAAGMGECTPIEA